jgi:drug/metabolite transporter (DMT)-like permease
VASTTFAPARASARTALLIALCGFASLSCGDAVVKSMAGAWPAPAVSALRYTFGTIGLVLLVAIRHGRSGFVLPRPALQFGRGVAVSVATLCFFGGVMVMPLADATAIQFTSPVMTALLAPLVLGERTTRATWLATLLAFAGVLVVLRPNLYELGVVALFPIGAAFGMSWLMMFNRKVAGDAPMLVMQLLLAAIAAPLLILAAFLLARLGLVAIPAPSMVVVGKCVAVACFATLGHALIFAAVERADASVVAPMTYVQLLVAACLGWLAFGDAPDATAFGGAALIIGGGLLLWRAQRVKDLGEAPS